jgi:hypothetical protein
LFGESKRKTNSTTIAAKAAITAATLPPTPSRGLKSDIDGGAGACQPLQVADVSAAFAFRECACALVIRYWWVALQRVASVPLHV